MAKTLVADSTDGTRVPFLRGILTRSLHDSGIEFDAAYKLASAIRQQLSDVDEISTEELKHKTLSMLEQGTFDQKCIEAYKALILTLGSCSSFNCATQRLFCFLMMISGTM